MTVEFANDFTNKEKYPFQLHVAIGGNSPEDMKIVLQALINDGAIYDKPLQGIVISDKRIRHVITPVWNGKDYQ